MNHNSIDGVVQSLVKKSGFIDFEQSNAPCNWSFQNPLEVRFLRFSIETKKALIFRALKINGVNLRDYSRSVTITDSDGETYDLEQINLTGNLVFCAKTRKDPWVSIDLQTTIRMEGLSIELAKENYLKRDLLSLNIEHSTVSKNWETIHDNYAIFSTSEFHEFSLENQIMTASYCRNHSLLSDLFELNRKPDDLQSKQELLKNANNLLSQFGVAYGAHQFTRTFALLSEKEKNFKIGELVNLLNFFNDKLAISSFASSGSS